MSGTVRLRVLATSDLHMALHDHDYGKDRPDPAVGLVRTASLIRAARAEADSCVLFDNGDTFQGSPLGDWLARPGGLTGVHPMVRAMNALGYDAATLGNHDFNFGLPFLQRVLEGARFPYVCASLHRADGGAFLPATAVLVRRVRGEDGAEHELRIGVVGFLPPQVMAWDRANLVGWLTADDIVEAGHREMPGLRARADLVVALCHSGLGEGPRVTGAENAALFLAREVPGIDVLVTGHSHNALPGVYYAGMADVDAARGTVAGVPAVMPGYMGSHLGVVDLVLARAGDGWRVAEARAEARPIARREGGRAVPLVEADQAVLEETGPEHEGTVAWAARAVGLLERRVHSYFSVVEDDACLRLVHAGQLWYARELLAEAGVAAPKLLSAAAPFRAGRGGPADFVDLPAGPLLVRDVADLYPFANVPVVVEMTGAGLLEWLECAAGLFRQVDPGTDAAQALLAPGFPVFNFDMISGVTYRIDVTQPSRYRPDGTLAHAEARRIVDLRYRGAPVDPAEAFAVVSTNYRVDAPGFPGMGPGAKVLWRAPDQTRDALLRWAGSAGAVGQELPPPSWSFQRGSQALRLAFRSAPEARAYLGEHADIADVGDRADGFARFVLTVPPR